MIAREAGRHHRSADEDERLVEFLGQFVPWMTEHTDAATFDAWFDGQLATPLQADMVRSAGGDPASFDVAAAPNSDFRVYPWNHQTIQAADPRWQTFGGMVDAMNAQRRALAIGPLFEQFYIQGCAHNYDGTPTRIRPIIAFTRVQLRALPHERRLKREEIERRRAREQQSARGRGRGARSRFSRRHQRGDDGEYEVVPIEEAAVGAQICCSVCLENNPQRMVLSAPCGHMCMCDGCAAVVHNECPMCRQRIQHAVAIAGVTAGASREWILERARAAAGSPEVAAALAGLPRLYVNVVNEDE